MTTDSAQEFTWAGSGGRRSRERAMEEGGRAPGGEEMLRKLYPFFWEQKILSYRFLASKDFHFLAP